MALVLALSILATVSYYMFDSIHAIVAARILHGFGFGLSTTFAAAIVADVIPASRRGEGIGYFGLGSTVMMALAPAVGLFLLNDISPAALFFSSAAFSFLAVLVSIFCHAGKKVRRVEVTEKASLRDRICETGTGLPAILTIFFGAAYGSVNTYIAMMAAEAHIENAGLFFISRSFFADSSYMLSFSVLCSCVCSRLISPSVSSWHKQDNTLMHQSPGHIQRRTPYNF